MINLAPQGYKVEICNRQLTVDSVNEPGALLAPPSPRPPSDPRHHATADQTDYAETLGAVNRRYTAVASDTAERIKRLELQQLRWAEFVRAVGEAQRWLEEQEQRLSSFDQTFHSASVRQALVDCQVSVGVSGCLR